MKQVYPNGMIPKGHYCPAIISGNLMFISSQLPMDFENGKIVSGGAKEHALQCMKNIEMILKEKDLTFDNLVQCRIYVSDISNWGVIDEIYSSFLKEHKCARVVVPTRDLHYGAFCEIEAIAEIK